MKRSIGMVVAYGLCVASVSAASEWYTHDFWGPRMHGKRLSYCLVDEKTCGQVVADKYCQMQGYDRAKRATIDYNLGVTRYLDSPKNCVGWSCSGFKLLQCGAQTLNQPRRTYYYRSQTFVMPRSNHYRVDWCFKNGQGCGERAAFSFCRRLGFMKATHFKQDTGLAATRALGNQRLCFDGDCQGFSSITCHR